MTAPSSALNILEWLQEAGKRLDTRPRAGETTYEQEHRLNEQRELAKRVLRVIVRNPRPRPTSPGEWVQIFRAEVAALHVLRLRRRFGVKLGEILVKETKSAIRGIDPNWKVGGTFSTKGLDLHVAELETKRMGASCRIVDALRSVIGILTSILRNPSIWQDARAHDLARHRFELSMTAYVMARGYRQQDDSRAKTIPGWERRPRYALRERKFMYLAMINAGDAGQATTQAALASHLLQLLASDWNSPPDGQKKWLGLNEDEPPDPDKSWRISELSQLVKMIGHRMPPGLYMRTDHRKPQYNEHRRPPRLIDYWIDASVLGRRLLEYSRKYGLKEHYLSGRQLIRKLSLAVQNSRKIEPLWSEVMGAIFEASVRYGLVNIAFFTLQAGYQPDAFLLLRLASIWCAAQRASRLTVDPEKHKPWQEIFSKTWSAVPTSTRQAATCHQAMIGRAVELVAASPDRANGAQVLSGVVTATTAQFDRRFSFRQNLHMLTTGKLQDRLPQEAGPISAISVVRRGDHLHLLAVNQQRSSSKTLNKLVYNDCRVAAVAARGSRFSQKMQESSFWQDADKVAVWHLAEKVFSSAYDTEPDSKIIYLACDTELGGGIPWQELAHQYATKIGKAAPIVSQVPSLGWLAGFLLGKNRRPTSSMSATPVVATVDQMADGWPSAMRPEFERLIASATGAPGWLQVICGHGMYNASDKSCNVTAHQGRLGPDDLDDKLSHRIVNIMACSGGRSESHLMADMSGLPGRALMLGCKTLFAPMVKLPPATLVKLNDALGDSSHGPRLLDRYLGAIRIDPRVRLIGLFGLPALLPEEGDGGDAANGSNSTHKE